MSDTFCPVCQASLALDQDLCPYCGAAQGPGASAPARNLAVGSTLHQGKFTVGRVLGEGGFGITYKGAHRDLRRPVAVKELFPLDLGATRLGTRVSVPAPQADAFRYAREQALQEARIIAGFRSRNIVDVYDMFLENGTAYIVMEYLEGETLEARLERVGSLPPDEVQGMAEALCEALAEVHDDNWLHRDIKPSNIVLAADQRIVLIDFGSAREFHLHRTQRHTRILTAQYAAPEQYSEAARFGPYTDAFSLGATLYHALTGAPPPSAMDRFQSGRDLDFPPGVPSRLATALQQALALRIDDRPSSMAALLALIQDPVSSVAGVVLSVPMVSPDSSPESDREALNAFNFNRAIPEGWFSDVPLADWSGVMVDDAGRVIRLSIDGFETLPAEIGQLTQLQSLDLYSRLETLPAEIGQLTQLQNLHLYSNGLETLPAEIGQLAQLHSLHLCGVGLETLPAEIGQLAQLQVLYLDGNGLETLPTEIGQLTQLHSLDLSGNGLNSPPLATLALCSSLHSLDLSGNGLKVLPTEIGQLTQLHSLDLSGNGLKVLPTEIGQLTQLHSLDLSGNGLKVLPTEIGQLTQLHSLDLSGNGLKVLPTEIGQLTQLHSLDLSGNGLKVLPTEIGQLTLQNLDLSGNGLEILPTEIGQLTLQNLDLSGNRLQTYPPAIEPQVLIDDPAAADGEPDGRQHPAIEPQVLIDDPITVEELAEIVSRSPIDLVRILMKFGVMVPITQVIDFETASIVCAELDIQIGQIGLTPEAAWRRWLRIPWPSQPDEGPPCS